MEVQKVLGRELTCSNCQFSAVIRPDPKVLQSQLVCKRTPPPVVAVPSAQGIAMMAIPRVVADRDWCFQYNPRPTPAEPEVVLIPNPPANPN